MARAGGHSSDCSPAALDRSEESSRWPLDEVKTSDTNLLEDRSTRATAGMATEEQKGEVMG